MSCRISSQPRMEILLRVGLSCVAVVATASPQRPLHAAPKTDAGKALADEAAALFKQGQYLQAAELFERSFALAPDKLVRLRNAGRAYEEAGRLDHAKLLFERYLSLAPESPERTEVVERLRRLELRLESDKRAEEMARQEALRAKVKAARKGEEEPAEPAPAPSLDSPAEAKSTGEESERAEPASSVEPALRASHSQWHPTTGWWIAGGGAAVLLAGAVWQTQVVADQERLNRDTLAGRYSGPGGWQAHDDRQATLTNTQRATFVLMGVGTAAIGAGLAWALWPRDKAASAGKVSLLPEAGRSGAGATLLVLF